MGSESLIVSLLGIGINLGASVGTIGVFAHSLGLLPPEVFIEAANLGITLPPMPR